MALRRSMVTATGNPESTYYVYVNMARHEGSEHSHFFARQTHDCTASLVKALATLQNGSTVIVAPGTYNFLDSALAKGSNIKVVCPHGSAVFHGVGCIVYENTLLFGEETWSLLFTSPSSNKAPSSRCARQGLVSRPSS